MASATRAPDAAATTRPERPLSPPALGVFRAAASRERGDDLAQQAELVVAPAREAAAVDELAQGGGAELHLNI